MVKNGIDKTSVEGVVDSPYMKGWPTIKLSCIHRKPASRCCGCVRWGTVTRRLSWNR
jgi:hypothetical protein